MTRLATEALELRFGARLIQTQVSFQVDKGSIFAIMGVSGCGKSTLLRALVGLLRPTSGHVSYDGVDYWAAAPSVQNRLRAGIGMLFQSAALWSSMTLLENVCLPLEQLTDWDATKRLARAREVLDWVELSKFADFYPSALSGGMKKRAGLARAIATRPALLFLDEPSAGLDPINSRRLDDLVLEIRRTTDCAIVFVSHELPSLFAIADDGIFLDADSKAPIGHGSPRQLLETSTHPVVQAFLTRQELATPDATATPAGAVPSNPAEPVAAASP